MLQKHLSAMSDGGASASTAASSTTASSTKPLPAKLTSSGQNPLDSGFCIATHLDGSACAHRTAEFANNYIPYCDFHTKNGDPSLEAKKHPSFGMMCVARRNLPKNYLVACYGEMVSTLDLVEEKLEWLWECEEGFGGDAGVNPQTPAGAGGQIQYALCIGRHEQLNMRCLDGEEYCRCAMDEDHTALVSNEKSGQKHYGAMYVISTRAIPKDHQLNTRYSDEVGTEEFFASRGIPRCDVWTAEHPTFLKKGCTIADLETDPTKCQVRVVKNGKLLPHNSFKFEGLARDGGGGGRGAKKNGQVTKAGGKVPGGKKGLQGLKKAGAK